MSGSMIQNESSDQPGFTAHLVHHVHDLDHEKVDGLLGFLDDQHGFNHDVNQQVGQFRRQFGRDRGSRDFVQERLVWKLARVLVGIVIGG
jgi:hypothetical protein